MLKHRYERFCELASQAQQKCRSKSVFVSLRSREPDDWLPSANRLAAQQKAEYQERQVVLAEIEKARRLAAEQKAEQERLRLAEIEKARRLAAEQEAEHQRILAEQEAERQRILAEEAQRKTDLMLQITLSTRESIKVALDLIRARFL